jgi:hypothetical protein
MGTQARHADAQTSTVGRPQPAQAKGQSKSDSHINGQTVDAGAPITAPVIWSLQRTAGNAAIGQLTARSRRPAPNPTRVERHQAGEPGHGGIEPKALDAASLGGDMSSSETGVGTPAPCREWAHQTVARPAPLGVSDVLQLQRLWGNRQVTRLLTGEAGGRHRRREWHAHASAPAPATVQRWEGAEHVSLGDQAKGGPAGFILLDAHARDLPNRTKPMADWPPEWRKLHADGSALQKRVLEKGLSYGEIVALSGDLYKDFDALNKAPLREIYDLVPLMHYKPGDKFASTKELEQASGGRYLALAKENESHFTNVRPGHANIDVWWRQHAAAINAARNGNANLAWATNAAADHFLTDAFSGGHIRVARATLHAKGTKGDIQSKIAHDLDNENGVEVTNLRGDKPWIAYGDEMLKDTRNTRNRVLAEEAVSLSKQDIADALAQARAYPEPKDGTIFAAQKLVPHPIDPSLNRWGATDKAKEIASLVRKELPGQITAIWQDDNRARAWIRRQSPAALGRQSVADRVRMIKVLLDGPTLDDDENAILRVLRASVAAGDQVAVIDTVGAHGMVDDFDGSEYKQIRALLRASYYGQTSQGNALRLIAACIDGWTREWEESMIVDVLELQPNGRALVEQVGQRYGGSAKGPDKYFRNGMHELEDQLDGSDETKLHQLFPKH